MTPPAPSTSSVAPIRSGATSCPERAKNERRRRGNRAMTDLLPAFGSTFCVPPATVSRHSNPGHTVALATPRFGHRLPRHHRRVRHCKALSDFKVLLPDRLFEENRSRHPPADVVGGGGPSA